MKNRIARGDVLTGASESNRFIQSSAIHSLDLDSLPIADSLTRHAGAALRGAKADHFNEGAVSSVVEHYLDTSAVYKTPLITTFVISLL
jgi:hypothetical protein